MNQQHYHIFYKHVKKIYEARNTLRLFVLNRHYTILCYFGICIMTLLFQLYTLTSRSVLKCGLKEGKQLFSACNCY